MLYTFGDYILDSARRELRRQGRPVPLEPKGYQVLLYLVQHRERLVTKDELLEQVWPEVYVIDTTVSRCLTLVRKAVGDSGTAQRVIKTRHGQGYRFVAPVEVQTETLPEALPVPASTPLPLDAVARQYCGACQQPNAVAAQFCTMCGAALEALCPYCGQPATPSATFCSQCGHRLEPPTATASTPEPPAPAAPSVAGTIEPLFPSAALPLSEGERKLVTVLSGSVSPAVSLLPGVDLEEQQGLLERLGALVRAAVQPYAGTLQHLGSDQFRVVFGAPQAQEDHAHQALRAALALRQRWAGFCRSELPIPETPVALGLGIHTGQVVVRTSGGTSLAQPLVGDVLLLADSLAHHAVAETLLVSAATAQLVSEAVCLEAGPSVPVPGQAAPLVAYRVTDRLGVSALGTGWEVRRLGPFVGRQGELAALHTHLTHVLAGHGQVVGLVGAHGMGKSRLLAEFRHSLAAHPVTYLAGPCQSYGGYTPYFPLLALLRQWWGILEGDSPTARTARVRDGLQKIGLRPDDWAPAVLQLLDGPAEPVPEPEPSPQALRAQTFATLHQIFVQGSQHQPLVVEVENLHWIDATSEEYLTALVERLGGLRLLLLVTYRPGYRPPWQAASITTQLALAPLTPADSQEVVRAVRRGAPLAPVVEAQIVATGQGNPFFLEELTRAVAEQDTDAPTLVVPDTIQAVLMARIDRLPAAAKRLLQTAAVIGREVPLSLLRAVVALPEDAMQQSLRHLQASELLYESRLAPEQVYTFTHSLTQEVAYQSLLRRTRQQLHAQIAQLLTTRFARTGGMPPELLASHYSAAGHHAQALPYWIEAGRHAIRRAASVEARAHLTHGLAALQTLPASPERTEHELTLQLLLSTTRVRRRRTIPL
jgi:DNA-binding winged helix-turn-helix (wHTH) protein/class 3 adenylate cyclase